MDAGLINHAVYCSVEWRMYLGVSALSWVVLQTLWLCVGTLISVVREVFELCRAGKKSVLSSCIFQNNTRICAGKCNFILYK